MGKTGDGGPGNMWSADDPLAKLDGETPKANKALHDYAEMGWKRSLPNLYRLYAENPQKTPTKSLETLKVWSADHEWQARVKAWDETQRLLAEREFNEEALEDRKKRITFMRATRGVLTSALNYWQEEIKVNPSAVAFRTLVNSLATVNGELRTEYGEPTVRADITSNGKELGGSAQDAQDYIDAQRAEIERTMARIAESVRAGTLPGPTDQPVEP